MSRIHDRIMEGLLGRLADGAKSVEAAKHPPACVET
jgi:hypothetical protein